MKAVKIGLSAFAWSTSALLAINVDEVIQLHKAGLKPDAIVNMIRIDGPDGKPSVEDLIKMKNEKVPDFIIEAYTAQSGVTTDTAQVTVEGPTLKIEDKISIAEYRMLQAQATASTRKVSIDDPSYRGLGEAGILFYLVKKNPDRISDDLILAFVNFDGRYSNDFYRRIKSNEFEFNREKPRIVDRMIKEANSKSVENITYETRLDIGEYDFSEKQFTPDFFGMLNRGYIQVAGAQYPIVIENQGQWFKSLPLSESDAKMRLNISPNRRVDARWGFTIKEVSKERGVVLEARTLNLLRDLNSSGDSFWKYNIKYAGPGVPVEHPEFPKDKRKNMGDFKNPHGEPSNLRVFLKGFKSPFTIRPFHDRFQEDEYDFFLSLPKEQRKAYLSRRLCEKYYDMPFDDGQHRYVPSSKPDWVKAYLGKVRAKREGSFDFSKEKLNVLLVDFKKGFLGSKVNFKTIHLNEKHRDVFENGTLSQIESL